MCVALRRCWAEDARPCCALILERRSPRTLRELIALCLAGVHLRWLSPTVMAQRDAALVVRFGGVEGSKSCGLSTGSRASRSMFAELANFACSFCQNCLCNANCLSLNGLFVSCTFLKYAHSMSLLKRMLPLISGGSQPQEEIGCVCVCVCVCVVETGGE